ncbi:MAG: hypothetical protein PHX62_05190 [Bacilli bacterium]|nr:hypothetical protein [Bacilli bacterium]
MNEQNSKLISYISSGVVVNYVSEYLENVFGNLLNQEQNPLIDKKTFKDYLIAIIVGGIGGLFFTKVSDFKAVVLAVGLNYGLYASIDDFLKKDVDWEKYFKSFFVNSFNIYLISIGYQYFLKGKDQDESSGFLEITAKALPFGVILSLYFALKDYLIKNNNDLPNQDNHVFSEQTDSNSNE